MQRRHTHVRSKQGARAVVTIKGIAMHRIIGGKLVEHWAVADKLSFLQQLGALPPLA